MKNAIIIIVILAVATVVANETGLATYSEVQVSLQNAWDSIVEFVKPAADPIV